MENTKRRYMEIREGMQDVQYQVKFLGAVMTSDIALGEEARAGAMIVFNGISSQLAELSEKAAVALAANDQGSAPS